MFYISRLILDPRLDPRLDPALILDPPFNKCYIYSINSIYPLYISALYIRSMYPLYILYILDKLYK